MALKIYYDGDCPFCANYVAFTKLRETVGEVSLIDLRTDITARHDIIAAGINPDLGMVVDHQGTRHVGQHAVHHLSRLSSKKGALNWLSASLLSNATISRASYPALRTARNITLALLGRKSFQAAKDADSNRDPHR